MQPNPKSVKLELANKYRELTTFIERYAFYQKYFEGMAYDPQDPLMIEFEIINKELAKFDEGKKPEKATISNDLQERSPIIQRKLEIRDLLTRQNEEIGIFKPEPSNDLEGGQMIEYNIKQCIQYWKERNIKKPTFEEKQANILAMIEGKINKVKIVQNELAKTEKELEKFKKATGLLDRAIKLDYKIDFLGLYKMANEEENPFYPFALKLSFAIPLHYFALNYEELASAIPLVQFKYFLKNQLRIQEGVQRQPEIHKVIDISNENTVGIQRQPEIHKEIYISNENIMPVYKALVPYFRDYHIEFMNLLNGKTINGKISFNGSSTDLCFSFSGLVKGKIIDSPKNDVIDWLLKYFTAKGKNLAITTTERSFDLDLKKEQYIESIRRLVIQ